MLRVCTYLMAVMALWGLLGCGDDAARDATSTENAGGGGPGGGGETGGGGAGGAQPSAAELALPKTLALPYVNALDGAVSGTFAVTNVGGLVAEGPDGDVLAWTLSGDPRLSLEAAPEQLEPGEEGSVVLSFGGASEESIASATLSVTVGEMVYEAAVFGVAGDPSIELGSWETVQLPGGEACGEGLTIALPKAPFPHASAGYTDDTVYVFVPDRMRDLGSQDVVVHFHGHNTDVAETLWEHQYAEHFCASGVNGILVVPQGPVQAASGNFGKLMDPGGLAALLQQVLVVLYREESIVSPLSNELVLTAHSGGYAAVATNLDVAVNALMVSRVHLYDAVYAYASTFAAFVAGGGVLRSNYTPTGGTDDNNLALVDMIEQSGVAVITEPTQRALRDAPAVIYAAPTSHNGATRIDAAFADHLRFGLSRHRLGPRVELREAWVDGDTASLSWWSPFDEQLLGFAIEVSDDGGASWTVATEVAATEASASFAFSGAARVRVLPRIADLLDDEVVGSDVYRLASEPDILIVDGFDRILDGSFGGLTHDFSAIVGEAAGPVATVSNEALTEDGVSLTSWPRVIWLVGDESTADRTLTIAEQQILLDYVDGGGALVVSGSEVAFDLSGDAFLAVVFGATLLADDSASYTVAGTGPLASLPVTSYASAGSPYPEDYPDALGPIGFGEPLLLYGTDDPAAVGIASRAALIGFPLELVDDPGKRAALVTALLGFVSP